MPKIAPAVWLSLVVIAALQLRGPHAVDRQPMSQDHPTISLAGLAPIPPTGTSRDTGESKVFSDVLVLLLGTLLSLYATVVFERRKRYGEILRDVGRTRQHFEGYPVSPGPESLEHAHSETVELWHFLEDREWALAADGHKSAALSINRLNAFFYRAATCIEKMQAGDTKGLTVDQYLAEFQSEYSRIYDSEFRQYESSIRPTIWALIRPFPNPVLPKSLSAASVDYFNILL